MTDEKLGLLTEPHPGQELYKEVNGVKWARYPVKTRLALIDDDLNQFLKESAKPYYKEGDIMCLASKVVSICKGFYVKESDLKVTWFAKFLTRFVKKWPHDPGFAIPQKIQVAMNIVGIPRFVFAMIGGVIMKLLGKPGWFYRLAGHNIGAIDGFVPEMYPEPLRGYGFLAPTNPDQIADEIERDLEMQTAILDGNNVDQIVLGMSKGLIDRFGGDYKNSKEHLLKIISGNPQGQTGNTPVLIVREESKN